MRLGQLATPSITMLGQNDSAGVQVFSSKVEVEHRFVASVAVSDVEIGVADVALLDRVVQQVARLEVLHSELVVGLNDVVN